MPLETSIETSSNISIVNLKGMLNNTTAPGLESELLGLVDHGARQLLLDFSQVDYVSSAGLRVTLVLAKRLEQEAGRLVLCAMQPQVHEVFDISGFMAILKVETDRDAGLAKF